MTLHVGIDLGSQTLVGIKTPTTSEDVSSTPQWATVPTVFGFDATGGELVGDRARRLALLRPQQFIHTAVRLLGRRFDDLPEHLQDHFTRGSEGDIRVTLRDASLPLEWVVAKQLTALREKMCNSTDSRSGVFPGSLAELEQLVAGLEDPGEPQMQGPNDQGPQAVVAIPVGASPASRMSIRHACRRAGIMVDRMVHTTSAAAAHYWQAKRAELSTREKPVRLAIHDFGAGNFCVAVVEVDATGVRELAARGLPEVGGDDLDQRVSEWMLSRFEQQNEVEVDDDPVVRSRMTHAAGNAKQTLGREDAETTVALHLPFLQADVTGSRHYQDTLTIQRFDELVVDLVDRCLDATHATLAQAGIAPREVDVVLLLGGGARVGLLQERLESLYQQEPLLAFAKTETVASGASLLADPDAELELEEGLAHPIVAAVDGADPVVVFERGRPLPAKGTVSLPIPPLTEVKKIIRATPAPTRDSDLGTTEPTVGSEPREFAVGSSPDRPEKYESEAPRKPEPKRSTPSPERGGQTSEPEKHVPTTDSPAPEKQTRTSVVIRRRRKSTQAPHLVRRGDNDDNQEPDESKLEQADESPITGGQVDTENTDSDKPTDALDSGGSEETDGALAGVEGMDGPLDKSQPLEEVALSADSDPTKFAEELPTDLVSLNSDGTDSMSVQQTEDPPADDPGDFASVDSDGSVPIADSVSVQHAEELPTDGSISNESNEVPSIADSVSGQQTNELSPDDSDDFVSLDSDESVPVTDDMSPQQAEELSATDLSDFVSLDSDASVPVTDAMSPQQAEQPSAGDLSDFVSLDSMPPQQAEELSADDLSDFVSLDSDESVPATDNMSPQQTEELSADDSSDFVSLDSMPPQQAEELSAADSRDFVSLDSNESVPVTDDMSPQQAEQPSAGDLSDFVSLDSNESVPVTDDMSRQQAEQPSADDSSDFVSFESDENLPVTDDMSRQQAEQPSADDSSDFVSLESDGGTGSGESAHLDENNDDAVVDDDLPIERELNTDASHEVDPTSSDHELATETSSEADQVSVTRFAEVRLYAQEPGPTGVCDGLIGRIELDPTALADVETLDLVVNVAADQTLTIRVNGEHTNLRDTAELGDVARATEQTRARETAREAAKQQALTDRARYLENWVARAHQLLAQPPQSDELREAREIVADTLRSAEGCLRSKRQSLIDGALTEILPVMRRLPSSVVDQLAPAGQPTAEDTSQAVAQPTPPEQPTASEPEQTPEQNSAPRKRGRKGRRRRSG